MLQRPRPVFRFLGVAALLGGFLVACGGDAGDPAGPGTPPPPPPPPPAPPQVASVAVEPASLSLRVGGTGSLSAVLRDAAGNALSGRSVTWASSADSVATVTSAGQVTAVGPGSASISATSEGRSASAPVAVAAEVEGSEIGPAGGTLVLDGGALRLEVPAGAVTAPTFFGAERSTRSLQDPDGVWRVGGTAYTLVPEGATFAQPVTVTLDVAASRLPGWVSPDDVGLHRWDGQAWHPMQDVSVTLSDDGATATVSGTTTGFSDVTPSVELPTLTLSPESDHVNEIQRWVVLTVDVEEVDMERWTNFTYEWTTTGQSGEILRTEGNSAEYLTTKAVLVTNEVLDQVTVTVRAQRSGADEASPELEVVGTASIAVKADLQFSVEFLPTFGATVFGETEELLLVVRDRNGTPVQDDLEGLYFTWEESGFHGSIELPLGERTRTNPAVYRARPLSQQEFPAPRVDQVTVKLEQRYQVWSGTLMNPNQVEFRFREIATSDAFVRVRVPNPLRGRFTSVTQTTSGGACVQAFINVPRIPGATGYALLATDFGDQGDPFGGTLTLEWSGAGGLVEEFGDEWRVRLEGGCATNDFAITFRQNLYRQRYGNARLEVTVTEPD